MNSKAFTRLAVAAGMVGTTALPLSGEIQGRITSDPEVRAKQVAALRKGDLRGAAAVTGAIVVEEPQPDVEVRSLRDLTNASLLVVLGRIGPNRSYLDQTGTTITTQYDVHVLAVAKGGVNVGDVLKVAFLGGRVELENGHEITVRTPGVPLPAPDQEFVLFLEHSKFRLSADQRRDALGPIYSPHVGGKGMFQVGPRGRLLGYGGARSALVRQYANKEPIALLRDVREIER